MKKITELTEIRTRTFFKKDAYGNRYRGSEEYVAYRNVRSAGLGMRFANHIVDVIIFALLFNVLSSAIGENLPFSIDANALNISLLLLFGFFFWILLYAMTYAVCEYSWQKTPAKFLTQTIVINEYGNNPDFHTIALRSIIRFVPFEPISFLLDDNARGWHDRWSNTWVVTKSELTELKRLQIEQSGDE